MLRPAHTDSGSSVDGEAENPHHTRVELSVEEATITKQETFLFNVFITSWGLNLARTSDVSTLQIHGTGYWGATCLQTNSHNRHRLQSMGENISDLCDIMTELLLAEDTEEYFFLSAIIF